MKTKQVYVLAATLTLIALGLIYQKIDLLGLPIVPAESTEAWMVEAQISFNASERGVKADLVIPDQPEGYLRVDEDFIASGYNLAVDYSKDGGRIAEWVKRRASGPQIIYYRSEFVPQLETAVSTRPIDPPAYPTPPEYTGSEATAIKNVLDRARQGSIDSATLTRALLQHLDRNRDDEHVTVLRKNAKDPTKWNQYVQYMLHGRRIPTRTANYIELKDGGQNLQLLPWLEIYNGEQWLSFNPQTGEQTVPASAVLWSRGDGPLLTVAGGSSPDVEFSVTQRSLALVDIAEERARRGGSLLMALSLFDLPVQIQNVYRLLMVLPLGALVVVMMRVLVGFPTFGVFMPVLIALAFRETHLLAGIALFSLIVAVALSVRFYFEKLYLLLVPRVSAVLIVVLITMIAVSLVSHRLNIYAGLSISLFPLVIISMVVERMSVVWDELGPTQAVRQAAGSLVVAALCYWVMQHPLARHWAFVFPETVLIVLAIVLLLGRYSGYRLSELYRFRHLIAAKKDKV